MKARKFLLSIVLILTASFLFLGCGDTGDDDAPLIGVWEQTKGVATYENGDPTMTLNYPLDWIHMISPTDYDLDGDGFDEAAIYKIYVEVTATNLRYYADITVTDNGDDLLVYIATNFEGATVQDMGLPYFETAFKYNSNEDKAYTVSGNLLTGLFDTPAVYSISGNTLTITSPIQNNSVSGDYVAVITFESRSSSDLVGAVEDNSVSIWLD